MCKYKCSEAAKLSLTGEGACVRACVCVCPSIIIQFERFSVDKERWLDLQLIKFCLTELSLCT